MSGELAAVFRRRHPAAGGAGLEDTLRSLVDRARAAWPRLDVAAAEFIDYLAERVDGEDALGAWHTDDLYLACACAGGAPRALAAFDERFLAEVGGFVAQFRGGPAFADEVRQLLRERLLLSVGGAPPRIAHYTGRGGLRYFTRVAAIRVAIDLRRAGGEPVDDDGDAGEAAMGSAAGPAVALLKARYLDDFQRALDAALGELTVRQRNLLRLHHVDGRSLDTLATIYRVNRATIARWLAAARRQLVARTQEIVGQRLDLSDSEVESLVALVRSQLYVSVARFFAPAQS